MYIVSIVEDTRRVSGFRFPCSSNKRTLCVFRVMDDRPSSGIVVQWYSCYQLRVPLISSLSFQDTAYLIENLLTISGGLQYSYLQLYSYICWYIAICTIWVIITLLPLVVNHEFLKCDCRYSYQYSCQLWVKYRHIYAYPDKSLKKQIIILKL